MARTLHTVVHAWQALRTVRTLRALPGEREVERKLEITGLVRGEGARLEEDLKRGRYGRYGCYEEKEPDLKKT